MNRLTKWCEALQEWQENHDNDERKGFQNGHRACMAKLAEYENLEEQGLLLRLLCKIGSIVYILEEDECCTNHDLDYWHIYEDIFSLDYLNGIGKTVFLTREAAEKALEERKI